MTRQTQEQRWDHARDLAKHEPRPGEPDFPARLERPITTAEDIVVLVKALPNYADAAKLIEQYAGMMVSIALHDEAAKRIAEIEAPLARKNPVDIIFGDANA